MKKLIKTIQRKFCTFFALRRVKKKGERIFVNFPCTFTAKTEIGTNCHFNGMKISGSGRVLIGNNFHSGKNVRLFTSSHNYEGAKIPYDDTWITKDIIIEDNVWIGEGVYILAGSVIHEGAVIQAGSVVCGEIPYCAIAGGHPAKAFKYRDIKHYEELKEKQLFS